MEQGRWDRWGGWAGIVATAAFVSASVLLNHSPSTNQATPDITTYFSDERGRALAATYLVGLGATALLFFVGGLRSVLRRDERFDGLTSVAFAGGISAAAIVVVSAGAVAILAYRPDTTPAVARALYDANGLLFAFSGFPIAALLSASSIVVIGSGVLPRWVGWFGLVGAVAQLVGAASFQQSGAFMPQGDVVAFQAGAVTLLLWLLATAVVLLRGSTAKPREARPSWGGAVGPTDSPAVRT